MAAGQGVANDVGADEAGAAEDEDAEAGPVRRLSALGGIREASPLGPCPARITSQPKGRGASPRPPDEFTPCRHLPALLAKGVLEGRIAYCIALA